MSQEQSLQEWARTASFPSPVRWGDVESAVLDRKLPPLPEEAGAGARRAPVVATIVLGVLMYGAAVIGLVAVVVATWVVATSDRDPWVLVAQIAFFVALAVPVTTIGAWWSEGRRRGTWDLPASAVTGVAAAAALVVALTGWDSVGGTGVLMGAVAVGGLGSVVVLLAASSAEPRTEQRRRRWSVDAAADMRYLVARQEVLEILVGRGLAPGLDEESRVEMVGMPFGTWRELDDPEPTRRR